MVMRSRTNLTTASRRSIEGLVPQVAAAAAAAGSRLQSRLFQLLGASLDGLTDMVLITEAAPLDAPGPRIVFANRAMLAQSGYELEQVLGATPRLFQGPQTQREALDRVRQALTQCLPVRVELINHARDGHPYWVDMEIVPVPDERGHVTHFLSIQRDITGRVEIDAALRDSEERYRSLTELSSDWFWEQDEHFRFTRFDGNLPPDFVHANSAGRHPWDVRSFNMSATDWEAHRRILEAHLPFRDLEVHRPRPDGSSIWTAVSGEPMFDAQGRFRGYRGVGKYITDRKHAELALQQANDLLRVSLENMRQGLVMVDRDGRLHLHNRRFLELLNLPDSAVAPGATAMSVLAFQIARGDLGDDVERHRADIESLVGGRHSSSDLTYVRRTPWGRVIEISTRVLDQGGFVRTYTDLTEHLQAQEALRDSEERFRQLTRLSSDWYWEQDAELRYTRVEGRGLSETEHLYLGKTRWELGALNMAEADWAAHRAVLEARQDFHQLELHRRANDGNSFWVSISGTPIFDAQGRFKGYRGVARSITATKRAELDARDRLAFSQRLTANVPGMVYQLQRAADGSYSFPFVSDGVRELFELDPQTVTAGKAASILERIQAQDRDAIRQGLDRSRREMAPFVLEYRVQRPDGSVRWHATQARPAPLAQDVVVWYGYASDITERVRVGERLREANELLEVTLSSLSQGVVMFDPEGRAVFYNRRFLELMNFPQSLMNRQPTLEQMVDFQYERGDFGQATREEAAGYGRMDVGGRRLIAPGQYVRRRADGRSVEIKTRELASGGWVRTYADVTDYFDAQEALQRSEERLALVLQGSNDGAWDWNLETGEAYFSPRWWAMLGYRADELPSRPALWGELTHPLDSLRVSAEMEAVLGDGTQSFELEFRMRHRDGHDINVLDRGFISRDASGRAVRLAGTLTDITARKRLEQRLEESEARLSALFEAIPDRIWLKDLEGRYVLSNPGKAAMYGRTVEQMLGRTERELVPDMAAEYEDTDRRALNADAPVVYEQEVPLRPGGPAGVFEVIKRAVHDHAGEPIGVLGVARDITERKRAEAQIERLAFYDPLTQLCNRRLFQDRLEQAQAASARSGEWAAVCFIDLDNFKDLNDTLGHDTGDQLLRQVGERLKGVVREQDTVARLGGDEFVVLVEQLGADPGAAALYANQVGQKILGELNAPYELSGGWHHNTPSIGVTLFRHHEERTEDILKRADLAMYQSKSAGRNTVRFFDPNMQAVVLARSALERDLRQALAGSQLLLYYQSVVNAQGRTTGYEALLRWQHPERGMVSPADFVPVAEQTGLILPMGQWVLQTACEQLARWARDPARAQLTLAVNLSARQLRQNDFVSEVEAVLRETGARPERLKLELTESLLLHDIEETILKMQQLAALGIRFALDDFGTGYSSLSYLKRLPLSQLKIDQSFVRDLLTDPNDAAIARTILQLAQSLDLDVVAEGVETEGQRQFLELMGCKAFQGYLFGRPAPLEGD